MIRAIQIATLALILTATTAVGLGMWGAFGLNRSAIVLVQDLDAALKSPDSGAHVKSIIANADAFTKDGADFMHSVAHPSKGDKLIDSLAKFVPHIF